MKTRADNKGRRPGQNQKRDTVTHKKPAKQKSFELHRKASESSEFFLSDSDHDSDQESEDQTIKNIAEFELEETKLYRDKIRLTVTLDRLNQELKVATLEHTRVKKCIHYAKSSLIARRQTRYLKATVTNLSLKLKLAQQDVELAKQK